jgi:hypothetical protein
VQRLGGKREVISAQVLETQIQEGLGARIGLLGPSESGVSHYA